MIDVNVTSEFAEAYYRPIRDKERAHLLNQISWRIPGNPSWSTLTDTEELSLTRPADEHVQFFKVTDEWYTRHFLIGSYAGEISDSKKKPVGYISFDKLENGEFVILQVQGIQDQNFDRESQMSLIESTINALKRIG
jgi:hypothetical protein